MKVNDRTLGIVSIATRTYLEFWKAQAESISLHASNQSNLILYLFTDQVSEAEEFASTLANINIKIKQIPSYGWPDATLLRYHIMSKIYDAWYESDVLMYLDADMLVVSELDTEMIFRSGTMGVNLVAHPGFYRGDSLPAKTRLKLAIRKPKSLIHDVLLLLTQGGLGFWETRKASRAYLSRRLRRRYLCGGVWWANKTDFLEFCRELATDVDSDSEKGITAIWHDESHLNRWAGHNDYVVQPPSYCYVPTYPWLEKLQPVIEAVDKGLVDRNGS